MLYYLLSTAQFLSGGKSRIYQYRGLYILGHFYCAIQCSRDMTAICKQLSPNCKAVKHNFLKLVDNAVLEQNKDCYLSSYEYHFHLSSAAVFPHLVFTLLSHGQQLYHTIKALMFVTPSSNSVAVS